VACLTAATSNTIHKSPITTHIRKKKFRNHSSRRYEPSSSFSIETWILSTLLLDKNICWCRRINFSYITRHPPHGGRKNFREHPPSLYSDGATAPTVNSHTHTTYYLAARTPHHTRTHADHAVTLRHPPQDLNDYYLKLNNPPPINRGLLKNC